MTDQVVTGDATGLAGDIGASERAYLIVDTGGDRTRVIPLPEGAEVTVGRSRTATIQVDHEKVSRLHARVLRRGAQITVEDLGSRNGTRVNGARIEAQARLSTGDEIAVGPALAVLALTTPLRRRPRLASDAELEDRLEAEVDRAVRYQRPLALLMLRLEGEAAGVHEAADRIAAGLRRMDLFA